ncbi:unnamed protein product [Penicillium glandicola]
MACSLSDEAAFIKQQEILRDRCSKALAEHLEINSEDVWTSEDDLGMHPSTKEEEAQLKLILDVQFDEETGHLILPPSNNRLSDELVYLVVKFTGAHERARRYPYDFDKLGDIKPQRVSSGPAPIVWAHGLPFFPVYKGYYILCGREHAGCIGWLLHERTREIMRVNPIWSIGAVIAPDSAVKLHHTVEPQASGMCKTWARDVVAAEHHLCAVLPNLDGDEIEVCPMWKAWGYNVSCGPMLRGVKPTIMPKGFFTSHDIKDINYGHLSRPYANYLLDEDDETVDEIDADGNVELEDLPGKSGEVAGSSNEPIMTQSASELDGDMEINSTVAASVQAPVQDLGQDPEEVVEEAKEVKEVKEKVTEKTIKEIATDPEIAPSDLEEKQSVASSSVLTTELYLGINIGDPIQKPTDKPVPEQTRTADIFLAETTIQTATIAHPTDIQLTIKHPELEQVVPDTSAEDTRTIEPLKVEQIAPEQPSTEQQDLVADGLSEEPKVTEYAASQLIADETETDMDMDKNQAPSNVPV